jgi:chromosome segregation ATPase
MLTLESLKTEVDDIRGACRMADSDAMQTRQLLTAQTSTINALRADQMGLRGLMDAQGRILSEQGIGIGNLVIAMNQTQQEVHALRTDVHGLKADVTGLQLNVYELKADVKDLKSDVKGIHERLDKMEVRMGGMEVRMDRMEVRMDGMEVRLGQIEVRLGQIDVRQDRMDRNLVAIMNHLGVDPVES